MEVPIPKNSNLKPVNRVARDVMESAPATLTIDDQGIITECSNGAAHLCCAEQRELLAAHVSKIIPRFGAKTAIRDGHVDSTLEFLTHARMPFRIQRHDGGSFVAELVINQLDNEPCQIRIVINEMDSEKDQNDASKWCI
ncbi:MAG: hypothetical protein HYX63_12790 [Gammaproteobacteria bacterium]|nr:hypothetical protein [Gammaproteobacteria bacterium]